MAGFYVMPFVETSATATTSGVLGYEHGMSPHGSLLAVIGDDGRCQAFRHEVDSMLANGGEPLFVYIVHVFLPQVKSAAEVRLGKTSEEHRVVIVLFRRLL